MTITQRLMRYVLSNVTETLERVADVDMPLYGILDVEVPHVRLESAGAVTSPSICWTVRGAICDWSGPGPCWVISSSDLENFPSDCWYSRLLGLSTHELSHCLSGDYDYSEPAQFDSSPEMKVRRAAVLSSADTADPAYPQEHNPSFIHCYLDIWQRLDGMGVYCPLSACGPLVGYKQAGAYVDCTLAEITEIWNEQSVLCNRCRGGV